MIVAQSGNSDHRGYVDGSKGLKSVQVRNTKGMSLVIDVIINGTPTEAVVDTAAMVSLISQSFFDTLRLEHSQTGETVILKGLSNIPIQGTFCENLNLRIGQQNVKWKVCVAPMTDNVILGIDFLKAHACLVDLGKNILGLGDQIIPAKLKVTPDDDTIKISRVHASRRSVIPPQTIGLSADNLHPIPETRVQVKVMCSNLYPNERGCCYLRFMQKVTISRSRL